MTNRRREARVLEGLKVVESVANRIEAVETVQAAHTEKLIAQEADIQKNTMEIVAEKMKVAAVEERLNQIDNDALNIRQTNAVVREIREIEKREKNVVIGNVPEPTGESADERKKEDEIRVNDILRELKSEQTKPVNVIRVGIKGRYPRKILVILQTVEDCERILKSGEATKLAGDVFITRDRTFNQRQEARLFRMEKEKEEREGTVSHRGRSRGIARGPGRPRGRGAVRGRGSRAVGSESRKRRNSATEDESKRRRTNDNAVPAAQDAVAVAAPRGVDETPGSQPSTLQDPGTALPIPSDGQEQAKESNTNF